MPGRLNLATLTVRASTLRELSAEAGRATPRIGIVPPTVVAEKRAEALAVANVTGLAAWANKARFWVKPPSGRFESLQDLRGALLAGDGGDILEGCAALGEAGADLVVFDFRMAFERYLEQMELLAATVLPALSGPLAR